MRANRSFRDSSKNDAQVGIGTMIVFIATVLVAAIAAGVLIDTSGKLQERSSRTGNEATNQVASNLAVLSVVGRKDATTTCCLDDLDVFVTLAPGAKNLDLAQLRIQLNNGTSFKTFNYTTQAVPVANQFSGASVRDADSSYTAASPVLTAGDMVNITIALDTNTIQLPARDSNTLVFVPEVGNKVVVGFRTPESYGQDRLVELK